MVRSILIGSSLLFLVASCQPLAKGQQELQRISFVIHIDSNVTDGWYSIQQIADLARGYGIDVVFLTDDAQRRCQYGIPPLRRLIRKTEERDSVFKFGVKRYLRIIDQVNKDYKDILVLPGVEVTPFYYWKGELFKKNLQLFNFHKDMLVVGLERARDYRNLPMVSNGFSLRAQFRLKDGYRLWPVLLLILGIFLLQKKEFRYEDQMGNVFAPHSTGWGIIGIVIVALSLPFLMNNFPFRSFYFDQYHGDQGDKPYQLLIDYVNKRGGLIFWAHPDEGWQEKIGPVELITPCYPDSLLSTHDYTGFSVFYGGEEQAGRAGGQWDRALNEYCEGLRRNPVWAIGSLEYTSEGHLATWLNTVQNILLVSKLNQGEVFDAIRRGRMYVLLRPRDRSLELEQFELRDSLGGRSAIMGEELTIKGRPRLKVRCRFSDGKDGQVKIRLIRAGELIGTLDLTTPGQIEFEDDSFLPSGKSYYRLELEGQSSRIVTNPIFVEFAGQI